MKRKKSLNTSLFSTSVLKLDSIEFTNNHHAISIAVITASMSHFTFTKRSRKVVRPLKNLQIPKRTASMNQSAHYQQNEEMSISNNEKPFNLQTNGIHEEPTDVAEKYPMGHYHPLSKRPRLCYSKRLQANARERERVHNLTAAFEALRQIIPMYHDQSKLSRLSILRIACSYVLVLGALNETDFSEGQNAYTLNESFHLLSSTMLNELKRRRPTNNRSE